MKNIIIIGAGGHASVIIDIIENMIDYGEKLEIRGILDDNQKNSEFMGYKILGKIESADLYNNGDTEYIIAIGNNNIRKKIAEKYNYLTYFIAVHPSAIVSNRSTIGDGTVIMPRVVINADSGIGNHVIINTGAIIEHDNKIGSFAHISPGATLCGGVTVGEDTHIGANSTIIQYKSVGQRCVIGAGSTVINNIRDDVVAVGSPTRIIK